MLQVKCDRSGCNKALLIAENYKEVETADKNVHTIEFSYKTFFFCSKEHAEDYAN